MTFRIYTVPQGRDSDHIIRDGGSILNSPGEEEMADSNFKRQHGYYLEEISPGMTAVCAKTITDADVVLFSGTSSIKWGEKECLLFHILPWVLWRILFFSYFPQNFLLIFFISK